MEISLLVLNVSASFISNFLENIKGFYSIVYPGSIWNAQLLRRDIIERKPSLCESVPFWCDSQQRAAIHRLELNTRLMDKFRQLQSRLELTSATAEEQDR